VVADHEKKVDPKKTQRSGHVLCDEARQAFNGDVSAIAILQLWMIHVCGA
jgi:hypothetical protein